MTEQQPRLFQIWLDASDGSIATYDGVQWPDGTADVHHRYRRPDGVQWSPQARAETIHGKLGRVEWTPDPAAEQRQRADTAEAQVARVRNFLEDMAGWCSPHGIAADYARRGLDALDGVDPLGLAGPTREQLAEESEAEIDAAMAAGEPVELIDLPELTAEDAVEAMQDMAGDLYKAEDRLAFVREMCDAADREQRQVTTEQVRAWTQYTGCGGVIVLPEADRYADMVNAPLRPETITAIAERIKSGDFPVRKIPLRGSYPARPGRATMAADRCPRCGSDNTEAWALCGNCEAAGEQQ